MTNNDFKFLSTSDVGCEKAFFKEHNVESTQPARFSSSLAEETTALGLIKSGESANTHKEGYSVAFTTV